VSSWQSANGYTIATAHIIASIRMHEKYKKTPSSATPAAARMVTVPDAIAIK
jgi:hypothetical protein